MKKSNISRIIALFAYCFCSVIIPVAADELKKRIMEINNYDLPFEARSGKSENDLVVEWKYACPKWLSSRMAD